MNKWDKRFIRLADHVSSWSKDTSTKVGAVVVDSDKRVLSLGYNGFPAGVDDSDSVIDIRMERPLKYMLTEHAERNAIYTASRVGVSIIGASIYCNYLPCCDCARAIIQCGIKEVYYKNLHVNSTTYTEFTQVVLMMFREAGVHVEQIEL
jgi:dCMP deaminase